MDEPTTPNFLDSGNNNMAHKVIAVATGEAHTLALGGDGNVYSWGRGTFGRLGCGSESDQLLPTRIRFFQENKLRIVGIAAGAYHSLALADDGSVWGWGYNVYGQIGSHEENSSLPCLLEGFLGLGSPNSATDNLETETKAPFKVSSVKAGGMMSLAIDDLGGLWIWGNCPHPQESMSRQGEFSLVSCSAPIPVWNLHGHTVVKVACGNEHVVALVSAEETYSGNDLLCYSWGSNSHGQLGLGDKESRSCPEVIQAFNLESQWEVYEVACGAFHTAVLTNKRQPSDTLESFCWTFGLGENGQLGHGMTKSVLSPEPVLDLPQNTFLISVDCGLFHTSVVSSARDVWSWGMEKGLGLCPDASFTGTDAGDAFSPLLITSNSLYGPRFPEPVQVACGAAHTVLVGDKGYKLWSWGRGRSGVLGNGKTDDYFAPTLVLWPPLMEDFRKEVPGNGGVGTENEAKNPKAIAEMEKRLSVAMEEMKLLTSKLSVMERYASILHGSVFGKPFEERDIPTSLQRSGTFDIAKEWESMLESLDHGKLARLEMFYRNMVAGVKDKLMKRRIQELIKECLNSTSNGN